MQYNVRQNRTRKGGVGLSGNEWLRRVFNGLLILLLLLGVTELVVLRMGADARALEAEQERQILQQEEEAKKDAASAEARETGKPQTEEKTPEASEPEEPQPEEPTDEVYLISFAGDCTLGDDVHIEGASETFGVVVGNRYDYPLSGALPWFGTDDLTLVNLEGTFTDSWNMADKQFCFRGPKENVQILTLGSVECVSLANNHTEDFGWQGYEDTVQTLEEAGVAHVPNGGTLLYETERGLKVGICAFFGWSDYVTTTVNELRDEGAQVIIASFHMGDEGSYTVTGGQISMAHEAIDAGAQIVYQTHPHVLQEIEYYNGGVIYYSLGNFAFGGNNYPKDMDTAIIQQEVIVSPEGEVSLGKTIPIPFCVGTTEAINDYCPTPYPVGSEGYERVLKKLEGTYP